MIVKNLVDEDFVNYKVTSMFIGCPKCSFKCDKLSGRQVCQNSALANAPDIDIPTEKLVERYIANDLTQAVVFGGLEPFDSINDVIEFINILRKMGVNDDVVIYSGFTKEELTTNYFNEMKCLEKYGNIVLKYGRFIPNQKSHYDSILGVILKSDNQYAERL